HITDLVVVCVVDVLLVVFATVTPLEGNVVISPSSFADAGTLVVARATRTSAIAAAKDFIGFSFFGNTKRRLQREPKRCDDRSREEPTVAERLCSVCLNFDWGQPFPK